MRKEHSFHIPVLGIGYSIDTPLKVAQYGIDSVVSLVDDGLLEKMRKKYCDKFSQPYQEITKKSNDHRAERITSYLNLINKLAEEKVESLRQITSGKIDELKNYFELLPDTSELKKEFKSLTDGIPSMDDIREWAQKNITMGSVDVNIMTKLDNSNYKNGEQLPVEYNDAHAALRGFAKSNLRSSIVLSAGMSPRLYSYIEKFEDFFPSVNGDIKKKIILKVSDYRSALVQGKFLAKKGLWVSEYRIESGLNCGGHAFATDGKLLGPILEEFKKNREALKNNVLEILKKSLGDNQRTVPSEDLELKVTAQGGVGTASEHRLLSSYYGCDSVGWGTPFMLVPEATSVDQSTLKILAQAGEDDVELSNFSPLGVKLNNVKGCSKQVEKEENIKAGKPGSKCTSRFLAIMPGFGDKGICTASKHYQQTKIAELESQNLLEDDYRVEYNKITERQCICNSLSNSTLIEHEISEHVDGDGVTACAGPNLAYFSKVSSLKEMIGHIYGRNNVISAQRPHFFIKELSIYIDYLKQQVNETRTSVDQKQKKHLVNFAKNLQSGVEYYRGLANDMKIEIDQAKINFNDQLETYCSKLHGLRQSIELLPVRSE